jgi:hypothetical protein
MLGRLGEFRCKIVYILAFLAFFLRYALLNTLLVFLPE